MKKNRFITNLSVDSFSWFLGEKCRNYSFWMSTAEIKCTYQKIVKEAKRVNYNCTVYTLYFHLHSWIQMRVGGAKMFLIPDLECVRFNHRKIWWRETGRHTERERERTKKALENIVVVRAKCTSVQYTMCTAT